MPWTSDLRRRLRRAEVRLGLALAGSISLLIVALLAVLFLVSVHEAAELRSELLRAELREARIELEKRLDPASLPAPPESVALRRVGPGGETAALSGAWPSGRAFGPESTSLALARAAPQDYLLEQLALPDGGRLEGAAPLGAFVEERREQLVAMLKSLGIGLIGIFAVSVYLTRVALAPLRNIRRAIEGIGERNLGARLPLQGTDDDIDRLRAALNRVFARLEDAFTRMRSYGADVAHELRTPLNRIVNLVDAGLLPGEGEAPAQTLEAVRAATQEMQRLVEDMLLLARGEEERLRVVPTRVDPAKLISDLVELYGPACSERGVSLDFSTSWTAGEIETDRALLQRALANLLDNALTHTPSGGRIEVALRASGEGAIVTIADSGSGVPVAERERIFERFVQLDPSRGGGAGLGLPIARMIARLLGGTLSVADSPLDGACFELRLRSQSSIETR